MDTGKNPQTMIYKILQRQLRLITRTSLKTGGKLMHSIKLSSPCSNSGTRRVTLDTNTGISQEVMMTWPDCRIVITTSEHLWLRYFVIEKIIRKCIYIYISWIVWRWQMGIQNPYLPILSFRCNNLEILSSEIKWKTTNTSLSNNFKIKIVEIDRIDTHSRQIHDCSLSGLVHALQ